MLTPRACDTTTGAFARLSERYRKFGQKGDLGSLRAPGPHQRDRTGRNVLHLPTQETSSKILEI